MKKSKCHNCGVQGHYARDCPNKVDEAEETPLTAVTWDACYATANAGTNENRIFPFYEVCLDNCSQVNIIDPRLLTNIREHGKPFRTMNSVTTTAKIGQLQDFFDCQVCSTCPANILSQARVEDLYPITYNQGENYIVHMPDRDLVFERRDLMYVADFSDWIVDEEELKLNLMTVQEREHLYNRKEIRHALKAKEFLRNAGYPSEKEAIHLARDGNIVGMPESPNDIQRYFDVYGRQVEAVRGKTTKEHVKQIDHGDRQAKQQRTMQVLSSDIMHVATEKFLISVSSPLELIIVSHLEGSLTKNICGKAMQAQFELLRSRSFEPERVHADPQRALAALQGSYPGTEIDISGAGDHLDKVDAKIRRIKETIRSILAGLPYALAKNLIKDLVTYVISRMNTRRTTALNDNVCPRVKFTGMKIDYEKEYCLGFGDYVESYYPRAEKASNNVLVERTEPCIALYPSGNMNGSWVLYNLKTNAYVRRTQWTKLPMPESIINKMNVLAGAGSSIKAADIEETTDADDAEEIMERMHAPPVVPNVIPMTEAEAGIEDVVLPEDRGTTEEALGAENEPEVEAVPEIDDATAGLRRTTRVNAGQRELDEAYEWTFMHVANISVKKGLRVRPKEALQACHEEFGQMFYGKNIKGKVLEPLKPTEISNRQLKNLTRSWMFLRDKFDAKGAFEKMKGRMVADGRTQDRTIYNNNASPTVSLKSVFSCLKIAAIEDRKMMKVDISGAFLTADIDETQEVWMLLDKEMTELVVSWNAEFKQYVRENGTMICKVLKAMYGLVQAALLFYKKLRAILESHGFVANTLDCCVMNKTVDGRQITILMYVDDLMVLAKEEKDLLWVRDLLLSHFDRIEWKIENEFTYLGMLVEKTERGFEISMEYYIDQTLQFYFGERKNTIKEYITPAIATLYAEDDEQMEKEESVLFHSTVAKLLYLGKRVRPGILLSTQYLCTKVKAPGVIDRQKLERILGYLKMTKKQKRLIDKSLFDRVALYIDAAFACYVDGKSQSGVCTLLGNTSVNEISRKQKIVTKDITEAELVALSDHAVEADLTTEFLKEQRIRVKTPIVYQDNASTVTLVTKGGGKPRTKYLRVRQMLVKQMIEMKQIEVKFIRTGKMVADVLTKPLNGDPFHKLVMILLGWVNMMKWQTNHKTTGVR
jgi:hypothetical protein